MSTTSSPITDRQGIASPARHMTHRGGLLLTATVILLLSAFVRSALLRPFWFDELSTLFMTTAPSLGKMFGAISSDGNPPLYFLLARPLLLLPIKLELALRLPAIVAFALAASSIYRFVRRDGDRIFALMAVGFFFACSMQRFAIEARPYSLLMAFTGLTLCCWQSYCRTGKRSMLVGLALSVAGAILSHQYGVIYTLLPLSAGELARSMRRRRLDPSLWAAALLGTLTLALTFPPMLHGQKALLAAIRACPVFWAHPQLRDLRMYGEMMPPVLPLLGALALLALLFKVVLQKSTPAVDLTCGAAHPEDLTAAAMLTLFLPLMLILTHFGTNYFQSRYAIGSAMGISMVSGLALNRVANHWNHAASLAWTAVVYCTAVGLIRITLAASSPDVLPWADPVLHSGNLKEPIVIASALQFSPVWWYSSSEMRERLHYLVDLDDAGRHSDMLPEYSMALESKYTPMRLDTYQSFLANHRRFLLYCYGQPRLEWIKERLMREGWHLTLIRSAAKNVATDGETRNREMYEVSH